MCYFNESACFTQPYFQFHSDVLPLTRKLVEVFGCHFHLTAVTPVEQQSVRGFDTEKQRKTLSENKTHTTMKKQTKKSFNLISKVL